ncbi:hypothetical protein DCO58_10970 [Helicobacter saguini]|uniref:Uncharacterized protein n=1 Tax=Helicobacter saguini TaxID=1548018 RepID=A0A347VPW5_9HELI|nr:hypothetical protein [Helicobacter saguini]MWV61184.1 hypothetical protein [Helicobacter saguini]MWV68149.1 hypothetical protein [Helicobacter saguini]MWV70388.1 hypothetical protein [Helicobacter saguini]MWV72289.1 hypothetical protein [Helicobacter saguini]TLD95328.1 hypothetical protein LS64_003005 [Helicobacter saguini]
MLFGKFIGFKSYADASFYVVNSNVNVIASDIKDVFKVKNNKVIQPRVNPSESNFTNAKDSRNILDSIKSIKL